MDDNDFHFNKLLDLIHKKLNLNCRQYNEPYIKRRINSRIMAFDLPVGDFAGYLKILETNTDELRSLFDALTVNVTRFFRDINLWSFLKSDVVPKVISEKKSKFNSSIPIWSCGCSSGEEPYSLAILFSSVSARGEVFADITATDIDDPSLLKARAGIYESHAFVDMPREYLEKYFRKTEEGLYSVDDSLKTRIKFSKHNFFNEKPPSSNFEMIFCRNVIIYFTAQSKEKLINVFYNALADHGWLVIGESEILFTNHMKHCFYLYNEQKRIYRKERRKVQMHVEIERRKNWWLGYENKLAENK